jgi:hypothetical protein
VNRRPEVSHSKSEALSFMAQLYARLAPWLVSLVELVLLVSALMLVRLRPSRHQPDDWRRLLRFFRRLALRRKLSVALVGTSVLAIRAALIPILGIPQPRYNDEFSYLLAGDTFAHGRLTNPPHPMWVHFESFHIIQQPTYMSMYAPAEGIVLAVGQRLGHPWIGQMMVTALMCSALCWMLEAWLPPAWALLGGVLAVFRLGLLSYWMNTYWSGSVIVLGGALVMGALPRLKRQARLQDAWLMALGLVILANSRPYEGLIFSLPVAGAMLIWFFGKKRPPAKLAVCRVILPMALVLSLGAVATGYYYYRVTGSPLRMAYQVNRSTYAMAPYFLWQTPRPEPQYHHPVMRDFYRWELLKFEEGRTWGGFLCHAGEKLVSWWMFYLGPLLTVPLFALPWAVRDRKLRFPLLALAAFALGLAVETWTMPHYFAPATCLLYLVLVECMRHLGTWRRSFGTGAAMVRLIPVIAIAMVILRIMAVAVDAQIEPAWPRGNLDRARILRQLEAGPGRHLILVRYGQNHNVDMEYVYNRAEIDSAKVIWARDMGEKNDEELLRYFSTRQSWLLDADALSPQLVPYFGSWRNQTMPAREKPGRAD